MLMPTSPDLIKSYPAPESEVPVNTLFLLHSELCKVMPSNFDAISSHGAAERHAPRNAHLHGIERPLG
jgi:hypothetical protein